jgi:molecular chaperone Hsp33
MSDQLATALLKTSSLRALAAVTTGPCREAARLHRSAAASSALLAQGLTAAALLSALQKTRSRINLQLECDGPLHGLFAHADAEGVLRGYCKNAQVSVLGAPGTFRFRGALGNRGYLSVLRDLGEGEFYRSSIELEVFDLSRDLERFFETSEQLPTTVCLESLLDAQGQLVTVAGVLLQPLPDGDREALAAFRRGLVEDQAFLRALEQSREPTPTSLLTSLFPNAELEVMSSYPLQFQCGCSKERVVRALIAMGREELSDMVAREGKAEVTCEFCTTRYELNREELEALIASIGSDGRI